MLPFLGEKTKNIVKIMFEYKKKKISFFLFSKKRHGKNILSVSIQSNLCPKNKKKCGNIFFEGLTFTSKKKKKFGKYYLNDFFDQKSKS